LCSHGTRIWYSKRYHARTTSYRAFSLGSSSRASSFSPVHSALSRGSSPRQANSRRCCDQYIISPCACISFDSEVSTLLTRSVQNGNRFRLQRPRRVWDVTILVALGTQLRLGTQQHFRPRDAQRPLRGGFDVRQHIRCAGGRIWHFKYRHSCRYRGMHHYLWFSNRDLLAL
jgi:hypothetical protein